MPKEFYTEKDIEDMVKRGVFSLEVNDNVVLTDLAYEKAVKLGLRLVRGAQPDNPPSAPVRPYLTQKRITSASEPPASQPFSAAAPLEPGVVPAAQADGGELHQRIRDAVIARLGSQIDAKLLDVIITRVLQSTGVR